MFNLFSWVTDLVDTFTFYGGGKGGSSSSTSTPVDFFGKDQRAPYEQMLGQLLGIYPMSSNMSRSLSSETDTTASASSPTGSWTTIMTPNGLSEQWIPASSSGTGSRNRTGERSNYPGPQGSSILDFIKAQPGYQFGMNQGQQALERRFSSTGIGQSGGENIALAGYGQAYAGDYYQKLINNLQGPSGATMIGNSTTSTSEGPSGLGGVFGTLAGAALSMGNPFGSAQSMGAMVSDRNLKTNIKHINTINGIKIYSFNYIWSYIKSIGVMAQDLLKMPQYKDAVHMTSIGYAVDYSKLPI
jgi:hypothetical protein